MLLGSTNQPDTQNAQASAPVTHCCSLPTWVAFIDVHAAAHGTSHIRLVTELHTYLVVLCDLDIQP